MGEVMISLESELVMESQKHRKEKKRELEVEVEVEEEDAGSRKTEEEQEEQSKKTRKRESGGDEAVLMWDKLLARMALRVLLVEADDSTRQIIAALLRKCSYRVTAVSDGLKAWEILKESSHNIDLILTEVDLPSISGYALLTLIMEHEICKSIPVIMMSSQDSVSTVYKCMLKGAADYLVKPIRRNELRNLWQHVWRRQSASSGGNGVQDESFGQDKAEASSKNNAAMDHSVGDKAGVHRSKERIEKESDAQSSSTKPELEAEHAHQENVHQPLQKLWGDFLLNGMKMQQQGMNVNCSQKSLMHETETWVATADKDSNAWTVGKEAAAESQKMDANISHEACENDEIIVNSSTFDFISASINNKTSSTNVKSKFDSSPHLDLSLKKSHSNDFETRMTDERHSLRHSDSSAFTRYSNRPLQPLFSTSAGSCYQKEAGGDTERRLSSNFSGINYDTAGPSPSSQRSIITLANSQTKESQTAASCTQQRVLPVQIPVKGVTFTDLLTGYDSAFPWISCKPSGATPSPSAANQPESGFQANKFSFESDSGQLCDRLAQNINNSTSLTHQKQGHKLDWMDDQGHVSPTTDQSASNSFCNGAASHFNSRGYGSTSGSNSNVDKVAVVRTPTESNYEGVFTPVTNSCRSFQREAALTKFRLKRKDRCFEKKVRYESRKKLAEQRPRVKGQFIRQVHADAQSTEGEQQIICDY